MKKILVLSITIILLLTGVSGFIIYNSSQIKQITIPLQKDFPKQINAYNNFDNAVIKAIAAENNIKVVTKEYDNENDMLVALDNGDIDVIAGISNTKHHPYKLTYTYFTGAIVTAFNREVALPEDSYSFMLRKDDKELMKVFNDTIRKFKDNGKLKELEKEYLGDRVK